MAFKLSTGTRNALLGKKDSIKASTISFNATDSRIEDSEGGLLDAGFRPGDTVLISGSTDNDMLAEITKVDNNGEWMETDQSLTDESSGEEITIATVGGKAFADIFRNYVIHVYSGSAPSTVDETETGTLLLKMTKDAGEVTPGDPTNGLNFDPDSIASGILTDDGETISGVGLADGQAGYYRMYDNGVETGESQTAKRIQGTVGTSSAQLVMTSTTITKDATTTAASHQITLPAS